MSIRALIALAVMLAFGAAPLVADCCAISCDAVHASATAAGPTCHHGGSSLPRLGHGQQPCGHDHHLIVVAAAATAAVASRITISVPSSPPDLASSLARLVAMISRAGPALGASRTPLPLALSSALRI
jgi:hypothetical protein